MAGHGQCFADGLRRSGDGLHRSNHPGHNAVPLPPPQSRRQGNDGEGCLSMMSAFWRRQEGVNSMRSQNAAIYRLMTEASVTGCASKAVAIDHHLSGRLLLMLLLVTVSLLASTPLEAQSSFTSMAAARDEFWNIPAAQKNA